MKRSLAKPAAGATAVLLLALSGGVLVLELVISASGGSTVHDRRLDQRQVLQDDVHPGRGR